MKPTISIDVRAGNKKMDRLPEDIRNNLRRVLPDLGKRLGAKVEAGMQAKLQSHNRLKVTKQLIENPRSIYAKVALVWTGEASKKLVPTWLEEGTKPHRITARNAPVLAFFWPKIGAMFFGKYVNHPGNKAYKIFGDAYDGMRSEITDSITRAVRSAASGQQGGR